VHPVPNVGEMHSPPHCFVPGAQPPELPPSPPVAEVAPPVAEPLPPAVATPEPPEPMGAPALPLLPIEEAPAAWPPPAPAEGIPDASTSGSMFWRSRGSAA
jgi:hypothetical protein